MTPLDQARRLCRELGGPEVDLFHLPSRAVAHAEATGWPLDETVQDLVSGWLATRAQRGDVASRRQLLAMWRVEVLRWCTWNGRRGVDPEDLAHDVLVRAMQRLSRLTRPDGFRPWLWAVAWRVLREHERQPWRRRRVASTRDPERPSPHPGAEERLLADERAREVQDVLQALPLDERTVLWHAYVDRRTRAHIAQLTGWSQGTVNRRLTRARKRFRTLAHERGYHWFEPQTRERA